MLTNYIEKDIKRKCLICDFLLKNKHTNLDELRNIWRLLG